MRRLIVKTASRESSVGDCLAFWQLAAGPLRLRAYGALQRMLRVKRRAALIWVVLFGLYAATIGMRAYGHTQYAGEEPDYLVTAKSFADDGDPNVFDEYRAKPSGGFRPFSPRPLGIPDTEHQTLYEPSGFGLPLLITPAYLAGGAHGVELFLAALAALAVALGYLLALRVVPDPWALAATVAVGVSPPLLAFSTAVYPELAAGALLAGAALLGLEAAERPSRPRVF